MNSTKQERIFEHNQKFYILCQDIFEPDELFINRVKYITKNLHLDNFTNLITKSRLMSNILNLKCSYNSSIMKILT